MEKISRYAKVTELNGRPRLLEALPLAMQHVVAMIVGCVTPAIIISGAAGLDTADRVILIQVSLVISALSTLLQLFPIGKKGGLRLGAGLPVILGVSFAYVPTMQAIAGESGIPGKLVGSIDMYDKYTFVEVPREQADEIVRVMKDAKIKGKSVHMEKANRR